MSSIILLLFDKNFIIVFEEVLNILKKILGIFSGCFSNTLRNTLSKNWYFFPMENIFTLLILSMMKLIYRQDKRIQFVCIQIILKAFFLWYYLMHREKFPRLKLKISKIWSVQNLALDKEGLSKYKN